MKSKDKDKQEDREEGSLNPEMHTSRYHKNLQEKVQPGCFVPCSQWAQMKAQEHCVNWHAGYYLPVRSGGENIKNPSFHKVLKFLVSDISNIFLLQGWGKGLKTPTLFFTWCNLAYNTFSPPLGVKVVVHLSEKWHTLTFITSKITSTISTLESPACLKSPMKAQIRLLINLFFFSNSCSKHLVPWIGTQDSLHKMA